ncbi:MAG: DUF5040 domain-containing protein [Verrucomicrobiota bacterium]
MKSSLSLVFLLSLALALLAAPLRAAPSTAHATGGGGVLLTGASFASKENTWFEMGCRSVGVTAINRAIGGEAIANTANRMAKGTLYSPEELETMDALVIMQVHDKDVIDPSQLRHAWTDYETPFNKTNYAAAYDYVIKRYLSECYALRDNPQSRFYQTKSGKPAVIILCTHWHDARVTYNTTIRQLGAKWGLPVVEFDRYIGFSKDTPHPVTGKQVSLLYATDTQTTDGVTYGWHPKRGEDSYVQQRMAAIFADTLRRVLPVRPPVTAAE